MLQELNEVLNSGNSTQHFFSPFFMSKLLDEKGGYNFSKVARWTKKFNLFQKEYVFCPVNYINEHWALIIICIKSKFIYYFDSLRRKGQRYLDGALTYLEDLSATLDLSFNRSEWSLVNNPLYMPTQMVSIFFSFNLNI